jgi:hypothetical protein
VLDVGMCCKSLSSQVCFQGFSKYKSRREIGALGTVIGNLPSRTAGTNLCSDFLFRNDRENTLLRMFPCMKFFRRVPEAPFVALSDDSLC